jgi:uncharacterized protein (DUF2141 family)
MRYLVAISLLFFLAVISFRYRQGRNGSQPTSRASASTSVAAAKTDTDLADVDLLSSRDTNGAGRPVGDSDDSASANESSGSLAVRVSGLRSDGTLLAALFAEPSGFPDRRRADRTQSASVSDKTVELTIDNLNPGTFAVAVFQDLNGDGVLNKGAFGVPSEPYGFSNNAFSRFGPPSFEDASFAFSQENQQVEIRLR